MAARFVGGEDHLGMLNRVIHTKQRLVARLVEGTYQIGTSPIDRDVTVQARPGVDAAPVGVTLTPDTEKRRMVNQLDGPFGANDPVGGADVRVEPCYEQTSDTVTPFELADRLVLGLRAIDAPLCAAIDLPQYPLCRLIAIIVEQHVQPVRAPVGHVAALGLQALQFA